MSSVGLIQASRAYFLANVNTGSLDSQFNAGSRKEAHRTVDQAMEARVSKTAQRKSAEAGDLGTQLNQETCSYFGGSMEKILPQFGHINSTEGESVCTRCGITGSKVFSIRFCSARLCWECLFARSGFRQTTGPISPESSSLDDGKRSIKLFECLCCHVCLAPEKMSCVLLLCRNCLSDLRSQNDRDRGRSIESIKRRVGRIIGGRI